MTSTSNRSSAFAVIAVGLLVGTAALMPASRARIVQFSEAELFVELNNTDGDLGFHGSIDGGPWTALEIEGPGERELLDVMSRGRLRSQGMTQLFFESAEPSFDELSPDDFFRRFPEGRYDIEGVTQDGIIIKSSAILSHILAAPPDNVLVSGVPAAPSCDDEPLPTVGVPVTIRWDPVTRSHPEIGKQGLVKIRQYQLFVERAGVKLSLDLPPTVTEFEIPTGVTDLGKEFKFEIIARTTTGNNTAIESCFRLNEPSRTLGPY